MCVLICKEYGQYLLLKGETRANLCFYEMFVHIRSHSLEHFTLNTVFRYHNFRH